MNSKNWHCEKCEVDIGTNFEVEFNQVCLTCKEPLVLKFKGRFSWADIDSDNEGVLRYSKFIPVSVESLKKVCSASMPEFTRPIESKRLAAKLGVESVHLLAPISGPSGTFKDSEAAVVIAKCIDWRLNRRLSWHSTGNTARAYREYAIRAGLESDSYFPLACLNKFKGVKRDEKNPLIAYDGPFQEISAFAKKKAKERNTLHLAPLAWKIEGKALLAFSIFEHLPATNVIVQTIAGGYGILGLDLGIKRMRQIGLMKPNQQIRYGLFQIEGADTIARLIPLNRKVTETDLTLPLNPFEPTLQSTNPLSTFNNVRTVVVNTGSHVVSVSVELIKNTWELFEKECRALDIPISFEDEKSPFISWAGLVQAAQDRRLKREDRIVIIITGSRARTGILPEPDIIFHP